MSTYWGYECTTCRAESDHWLNHGDTRLVEVLKVWPLIKQVQQSLTVDILMFELLPNDVIDFLREHDGHDIQLKNEYGDVQRC